MNEKIAILPHSHPLVRPRNLLAVASGKGGVGKTWFSISLSQALSQLGNKVLLFDGDLGLANVDVQLGLLPTRDITAAVEGKSSLRNLATHYPAGGFDVVAGRSGVGNLATLPPEKLAMMQRELAELSTHYGYVLMDMAAGVDRTVRMLASTAGTSLVITNEEPTSLTDAYAFIKLSHGAGQAAGIQVVINAASSKAEGMKTYQTLLKACQSFLKISPPLAGIIRRDSKVRDCIKAQTPLLTRSPQADAAQDVMAIARKLLI
ncbi:MAG: cellulose synthase operon protein YhjQ/BcsQ [Alphaproteobacteria bacterium]